MNIPEKKEKKMNTLKKLGLYVFFVAASGSLVLVGAEGNLDKIIGMRNTNDLSKLFSKNSTDVTAASFSVAHQIRDAIAAAKAGNQAEALRLLGLARQNMKVVQAERKAFGGVDPLAALLSEETLKLADARIKDALAARKQVVTEEVSSPAVSPAVSEEEQAKALKEQEEIAKRVAQEAEQAERDRQAANEQRRQEEEAAAQKRQQEEDARRAQIEKEAEAARLAAQKIADAQARVQAEREAAMKKANKIADLSEASILDRIAQIDDELSHVIALDFVKKADLIEASRKAYQEFKQAKDAYLNNARSVAYLNALIDSEWFKSRDGQTQKSFVDQRDRALAATVRFDKVMQYLEERFDYYRVISEMDDLIKEVGMPVTPAMKKGELDEHLTAFRKTLPYNAAYKYGTAWYQASQAERDQDAEVDKAIKLAKVLEGDLRQARKAWTIGSLES